ncbi:MAG: hypothetical protein IPP48_01205 [Chitinophagaceae bacterium]|nr:hypothetical protein [Chitinophagaceae bacterium]
MPSSLKHLIKKYLWRIVFHNKIYGNAVKENKTYLSLLNSSSKFATQKLNIFTKADEDGILLAIFSKIGTTNKLFIDIGSNDCINSNCANLAFHHNWSGLFIDGNHNILNRGKYIYQKYFKQNSNRFLFTQAIVTTQNINTILASTSYPNQIDLLCIDLDGNDYHIWNAIETILPRVVIVEVQVEKGNTEFIPPYTTEFELYEDDTPKGASPLSMLKLAKTKGYHLVAVNNGCYNLFFVHQDYTKNLNVLSIEEALKNTYQLLYMYLLFYNSIF